MIPAQAVEAAAMGILGVTPDVWKLQEPATQERYRDDARAALEPAMPYILAALRPYTIEDQRKHGETW